MNALPTFPTKKARLEFFRKALRTHPAWARRALAVIFAYQTAAEQAAEVTTDANGVGFSGCDAELLSSFAKQCETWVKDKAAGTNKFPTPLSANQQKWLHKKIAKYAKQLITVLEQKGTPGIEIVKVKKVSKKKGKKSAAA